MIPAGPDGSPENIAANLAAIAAGTYTGYLLSCAQHLHRKLRGYSDAPQFDDALSIMHVAACRAARKHNPERASFSTYLLNSLRFADKSYRQLFFRRCGRSSKIAIYQLSQLDLFDLEREAPPEPSEDDSQIRAVQVRELFAALTEDNRRTLDRLVSSADSPEKLHNSLAYKFRRRTFAACGVTDDQFTSLRDELRWRVRDYL